MGFRCLLCGSVSYRVCLKYDSHRMRIDQRKNPAATRAAGFLILICSLNQQLVPLTPCADGTRHAHTATSMGGKSVAMATSPTSAPPAEAKMVSTAMITSVGNQTSPRRNSVAWPRARPWPPDCCKARREDREGIGGMHVRCLERVGQKQHRSQNNTANRNMNGAKPAHINGAKAAGVAAWGEPSIVRPRGEQDSGIHDARGRQNQKEQQLGRQLQV